jgi:hypothetical protein
MIVVFYRASRPAVESTKKWPGREIDHSPRPRAEVNAWSNTYISVCLHCVLLSKHKDNSAVTACSMLGSKVHPF